MTALFIIFALLCVLVFAVLMLRIRMRLEISGDRRLLFVGLGRSGPELDFVRKTGVLRVFGWKTREFALGDKDEKEPAKAAVLEKTTAQKAEVLSQAEAAKAAKPAEPAKTKKIRRKRRRSPAEIIRLVPACSKALWKYFIGLLGGMIVEQAEGDIEAGFDSPDLTGQAFGYYQAAMGAVPAVMSRIHFTPDWTGPSFSGAVRLAVALPVYRLVGQTVALIWRLPVRKIVKVAIGEKEGVQDDQQRS
ncbi:MAG: hypothetical protein KKA42_12390 [candidate division Zixibacteria bacterium]|nr:hypothetical protein [candidate division Zixibacteria bacterium]